MGKPRVKNDVLYIVSTLMKHASGRKILWAGIWKKEDNSQWVMGWKPPQQTPPLPAQYQNRKLLLNCGKAKIYGRISCRAEMCDIWADTNKPCWWCLNFGGSFYFKKYKLDMTKYGWPTPLTDIIYWCFWFTQASLTEGNWSEMPQKWTEANTDISNWFSGISD